MISDSKGRRQFKKLIFTLLRESDPGYALEEIKKYPAMQVINPLFSSFCSADEIVKWRGVTAMGAVVSTLADQDIESARVVMRRLMWTLNDESGGIGWGAPEAMGEIMAENERIAGEYSRILLSYIDVDGNYLEHGILQRGALWGVGRLAEKRAELCADAAPYLLPCLESDDPVIFSHAAWASGYTGGRDHLACLENAGKFNRKHIDFYDSWNIRQAEVVEMAETARRRILARI